MAIPDKKQKKALKEAPMPPLPFAHQIMQGEEKPKEEIQTVEQARAKIKQMQKFCDEVEAQIQEVYGQMGWTPQFLKAYLSNPNNFSLSDWEKINKQRKELMNSIMLEQDIRKEEEMVNEKVRKPQIFQESTTGTRKKKGMARRNWLPMR